MEEKVIVAWDGSAQARAALDWALHRQAQRGGNIRLVQVVDDTSGQEFAEVRAAVSEAQRSLAAEAERVRILTPTVNVITDVILGEPEHELRRLCAPGALLVVGTRDRDARPAHYGWSLGSRLAPSTRGALVIVPEHVSGGRAGVLVGVDGSESSMQAALVAAGEAVRRGEELIVVHAWLEPDSDAEVANLNPEFVAWLEEAHRDLLDDSVRPVEKSYPGLRTVRLLENAPASRALRRHEKTAALVVVGKRGYGPVRRLLLGSVSHSLILDIECPILVVGAFAPSPHDRPPFDDSEESSPRLAHPADLGAARVDG